MCGRDDNTKKTEQLEQDGRQLFKKTLVYEELERSTDDCTGREGQSLKNQTQKGKIGWTCDQDEHEPEEYERRRKQNESCWTQ